MWQERKRDIECWFENWRTGNWIRRSLSTTISETYSGALVHEFLWDVRVVGTVHLDSAVSLIAGRARRARLWTDGNHHSAGGLNLAGMFPGVRQLWLGRGLHGTPQVVSFIYVHGSTYSSDLCPGEITMGGDGAGHDAGFFRYRIFLGLGNYRQRNISHRRSRSRARPHIQRRAHHEFHCTVRHRTRRTGKGIELGVLFVRSIVSAVVHGGNAVAGDERKAIGVRNDRFANESVTCI